MTPDEARDLFTWLITNTPSSDEKSLAARWLIDSVVIDLIAYRIKRDDDYALMIAERIAMARTAIQRRHADPVPPEAKTA